MINTQIPSGLQALLQASQVLQQQAAPTAPGPQGPQPTVANRISQQIQQTAEPQGIMPGMRDMGQQAGIAGQIMAQKQAQQQQMAQNPQAVAQMAAQMLQGQGVAGLPSNMQFKEGGIIGFAEGETVPDPEAGLSIAERQDKLRREKGSIYSPTFGLNPEEAEIYLADIAAQNEGRADPEMVPVVGGEVPRSAEDRKRIAETNARLSRMRENAATLSRMHSERMRALQNASGIGEAAAAAQEAARPAAGGAEALAKYYRPYPSRGPMKVGDSGIASVAPSDGADGVGPPSYLKPDDKTGGITGGPPKDQPSERAAKPDSGIAALTPSPAPAVPRAEIPAPPSIGEALRKYQTPEDIAKAQRDLEAADAAILARRKAAPQFEEQGIAALTRAEQERQRLAKINRSDDQFNRFIAAARDLRGGDSFGALQNNIAAREEGNRRAALAHEQAVVELRKAKEARELGNLELERTHKANAMAFLQNEHKIAREMAKLEIETQATYDKLTAQERTHFADRQSATQLEMSRQVHQAAIETARLKQRAEELGEQRTSTALTAVLSRINQGQEALRKLAEDYPLLKITTKDAEKDPMYQAQKQKYDAAAAEIRRNLLDPAIRERDRLSAKLSGTSTTSNVITYDSKGKRTN